MDVDAIRVEVFKATGMNIDKGDPFFAALVMLSSVASEIKRKTNLRSETFKAPGSAF